MTKLHAGLATLGKLIEKAGLVIEEAVAATEVRGQGWVPAPVGQNSKVKVTFMNCRSYQKKREETTGEREKFKIASLNKTSREGKKIGFSPNVR